MGSLGGGCCDVPGAGVGARGVVLWSEACSENSKLYLETGALLPDGLFGVLEGAHLSHELLDRGFEFLDLVQ